MQYLTAPAIWATTLTNVQDDLFGSTQAYTVSYATWAGVSAPSDHNAGECVGCGLGVNTALMCETKWRCETSDPAAAVGQEIFYMLLVAYVTKEMISPEHIPSCCRSVSSGVCALLCSDERLCWMRPHKREGERLH
jgi:hypothetical protein